MRMKRLAGIALVFCLCVAVLAPMRSDAASSTVKVRAYGGVTKTYKSRKNFCYVNNKKISIKKTPIFKKNGCYMGPVSAILKNSSLGVKVSKSGNTMKLTYGPNTVTLKANSKKVETNGVKSTLGAAVIRGRYISTKKDRWIVPLKGVCTRLGISYSSSGGVLNISGSGQASENTVSRTSSSNDEIKLVLDAGHGGIDSGATGNGMAEKNLNLAIVLAAKKYFDKDSRFKVYYTRKSDTYPSLTSRCNTANNNNVDMFICVHINSASASAHGTETLWNPNRNAATKKKGLTSKELATALHAAAQDATGFTDRGLVSRTGLRVLNGTKMPACLIEYGFITNKTEAIKMKNHTALYGKALYNSVVNLMKKEGRY